MRRAFAQVDVFTSVPYLGNPVAVVLDGEGVSTEEMLRFTSWTNLSEATFVVPTQDPDADYRVRIFTPGRELPFAGHPTLGTCHAWLAAGGTPRRDDVIVQECGAGLVEIRRDAEGGFAFAAPPLVRSGPADEPLVEDIARMLGIRRDEIVDAAWADNGPGWVAVLLAGAKDVLALSPRAVNREIGVIGPHPADGEVDWEVRTFFPKEGVMAEDPVTGSFNAAVAQWLLGTGRASAPYTAAQGTALGRAGRVRITRDAAGTVWVGGGTVTCVEGAVIA